MPTYEFLSKNESEYNVFYFDMKSAPKIGGFFTDENGKIWKRIASMPQASTCIDIDPFDSKAFVEKTGRMKGTWGDLEKMSAEMSEKRAAKNGGRDDILEKYEDQKQKATGLESFRRKKNKAKEKLSKQGIILE